MLKKLVAIMLAAVMLATVFAGCGQTTSKDSVSAAFGSEPKTLDPGINNALDGGIYISHAFEGLTRVDKDGKTIPGVAEKWEISTDLLTYTFHLRDAKWSDGQPVKAQDFEYAWKRALDPKTASEYAYQLYYLKNGEEFNTDKAKIDDVGVKATNDKTLVVTLKAPTAYFIDLTNFPTYMPIRKDVIDANGDKWTQDPKTYICNGPFTMTDWKHNDEIIFTKNENYWDKKSVILKSIRWKLIDSDAAALSAFESGEIDVDYALIPTEEIQNLVKSGKAKIYPDLSTYYFELNIAKPPLDNVKVRKALALALDRTFIVEKVLMAGQKPAIGFVPYGMKGLDPKKDFRSEKENTNFLPETPNVEEAKKLLAEAGFPDGKGFPEVELAYNTNEGHKKIAEATQEQWKKVLGINVKLTNMEWAVFQTYRHEKKYQIARSGWVADYNDPMTFMDMWKSNSGNNDTNWANPKYDELINKAQGTGDQKVRMEVMHEAEKLLMDEMIIIPVYYYTKTILENPKLKGMYKSPLGFYYLMWAYVE